MNSPLSLPLRFAGAEMTPPPFKGFGKNLPVPGDSVVQHQKDAFVLRALLWEDKAISD